MATNTRHFRMRLVHFAAIGLPLLLFSLFGMGIINVQPVSAQGTHYTTDTNSPVLFIHGFNSNASIPGGCNGSTTWGSAKSYLSSHGYSGQLISIGFYKGDANCDVYLQNQQDSHCSNYYAGNTGTTNEDQRHIACNLDWYIWNNFTQHGQNVQLVTHSMGGTIVRWAIYAAGSSSLPPYLYVQKIVTMAAPHNGIPWGASIVCGVCLQLAELQQIGSSFLTTLQNSAQNPQASGGTHWTIMGSTCESWTNGGIDPSSEMGMSALSKVLYLNPPCYHHGDYLTDQSDTSDAQANYCDNACQGKPNNNTGYSSTFPHSLRKMWVALTA